jgi:hypothetical protein
MQDPGMITSLKVIVDIVSQLSVAVAIPVLAGVVLAEQSIVISTGQVIRGARVSSTTMTWVHALLLKQSSVAVQVLVIVISCGHDPPVVTSLKVRVGVTSQLSVAIANPVLSGPELSEHCIVIFAGQVMTGSRVSPSMVMI